MASNTDACGTTALMLTNLPIDDLRVGEIYKRLGSGDHEDERICLEDCGFGPFTDAGLFQARALQVEIRYMSKQCDDAYASVAKKLEKCEKIAAMGRFVITTHQDLSKFEASNLEPRKDTDAKRKIITHNYRLTVIIEEIRSYVELIKTITDLVKMRAEKARNQSDKISIIEYLLRVTIYKTKIKEDVRTIRKLGHERSRDEQKVLDDKGNRLVSKLYRNLCKLNIKVVDHKGYRAISFNVPLTRARNELYEDWDIRVTGRTGCIMLKFICTNDDNSAPIPEGITTDELCYGPGFDESGIDGATAKIKSYF